MRYRLHTGSLAWIIHRVTGVALIFYIVVHIYVLSSLKDPSRFEYIMGLMKNPVLRLSEIGLFGLVIAHSLNGVRLTLLDIGISTKLHKKVFWIMSGIGGIIFIAGLLFIMGGAW